MRVEKELTGYLVKCLVEMPVDNELSIAVCPVSLASFGGLVQVVVGVVNHLLGEDDLRE